MCNRDGGTIDHLLIHGPIARELWIMFKGEGLNVELLNVALVRKHKLF